MPLPVIADVFRVTLDWNTVDGVTPRNVINVRCTDTSDVSDIAGAFSDAYSGLSVSPWKPMSSSAECGSLTILPLDGTSAGIEVFMDTHFFGSSGGSIVPSTAVLMKFQTSVRGPRGRGRQYIGPCTEDVIDSGMITTTLRTDVHDAWVAFIEALATGSPSIEFGIASYVHADFNTLEQVICELAVGTQRRRQNQLR
jgi:hypothetical protein